ncbi:hypothetical protein JYK14_12510 [Siccirubricoccus sp. KC 17139]|uniref:DUF4398 domain-containing protein n=1 Tax=Siccirubricoccus soli TaxID=2899147 RepID=A0ABT1D4X1_9PROT|nr:hypothetical protein [Siccirubricoccus soli]MCO6416976.1 hypothetical protein [Siccirubricoccus soli]MCP2683111.1 hypothetical protein [Siccirubricoccus soli]
MSMLRRTGAVLALTLAVGLPAMTGLAHAATPEGTTVPQPGATQPASPRHFGRSPGFALRAAERDLSHDRQLAANSWLERAETSVLNERAFLQGKPDAAPADAQRVARLDEVVKEIGTARADLRQGHVPAAEQQAMAASKRLHAS